MRKVLFLLIIISPLIAIQPTAYGQISQNSNAQTSVNTNNDTATSKRKTGDPFALLPANIERLTYFGERADISPDNNRIAFMSKSFGDAMLIDLKTRQINSRVRNL